MAAPSSKRAAPGKQECPFLTSLKSTFSNLRALRYSFEALFLVLVVFWLASAVLMLVASVLPPDINSFVFMLYVLALVIGGLLFIISLLTPFAQAVKFWDAPLGPIDIWKEVLTHHYSFSRSLGLVLVFSIFVSSISVVVVPPLFRHLPSSIQKNHQPIDFVLPVIAVACFVFSLLFFAPLIYYYLDGLDFFVGFKQGMNSIFNNLGVCLRFYVPYLFLFACLFVFGLVLTHVLLNYLASLKLSQLSSIILTAFVEFIIFVPIWVIYLTWMGRFLAMYLYHPTHP